jgi:hypothetical protein
LASSRSRRGKRRMRREERLVDTLKHLIQLVPDPLGGVEAFGI